MIDFFHKHVMRVGEEAHFLKKQFCKKLFLLTSKNYRL